MSFVYGGINTDDLEGVNVSAPDYPNMGGLTLDTVETPGRDGRFYGGSRMTASVLSFRVTVRGENQQQADQRRLTLIQALDPSLGPRSLRLDNTENWHYPEAVVSEQIEWEKHIDRSKVIYDGTVTFETNFDPAMRQIDPSSVTGSGRIEFIADMGSTVSYPTVIFESGGDLRVRVNDFELDLHDTPPDTYGVLDWDEFKFYTAEADLARSIFYEWEGEPHASSSVKKLSGEVVARNLSQLASTEPVQSFRAEGTWYWTLSPGVQLEVGKTYTFSIIIDKISDDDVPIRVDLGVGPSQTNSYYRDFRNREPFVTFGERFVTTFTPTERELRDEYTWLGVRIRNNQLPTTVAYREMMVEELDTFEGYFDGDTVGHIVPGERISSLVNSMSHFERPAIYPGQRVEVEVTPIGSNTATPVIIYPNHRRL